MNDSNATKIDLPRVIDDKLDQAAKIENQENEKQQIKACFIGKQKQKQNTSKSAKEKTGKNLRKSTRQSLWNLLLEVLLEGDQVSCLNPEKI